MGETQLNMAHLRYRPDVDGLRALAIASVVLYHSQIGVFGGGFVGVDVFFVISGYLITLLIHDPIRQGRFSFAEFWERRVRRIFPMLALVVAVTTVFALLILFPADLRRYSASAAAAVGFYSNFLFFSEAGYFDAAAAQKPLLHTWSLGAEAQFYLFFPPILYLLRRVETAKLLAVLGAIAAGSFALSQWAVSHAPAFAFYLFPPRMWELLVGGFLAIAAPKSNPGSALANGAAALGLSLIGLSVFGLSSETPFPGAAALPSCLGTALIIYSGACESSLINRILSLPPFTYLGRISYSLYLWHWPVLVLAGYYLFGGLTPAQKALAVGLSLALSAASWRLARGRTPPCATPTTS